ncbi:MAG: hypothetical protein NVSMB18_17110 [Acetobacteraceae bacterium]
MTPLVAIRDLRVAFDGVPVLHGIDFAVAPGESLGLVGESGCGKSVTWLAALGLLPRQAAVSGSVRLGGTELLGAAPAVLDDVRGGRIALILQDPMSTLNPVHRIGRQVEEAVRLHRGLGARRRKRRRCGCWTRSASPTRAAAITAIRTRCRGGRTSG